MVVLGRAYRVLRCATGGRGEELTTKAQRHKEKIDADLHRFTRTFLGHRAHRDHRVFSQLCVLDKSFFQSELCRKFCLRPQAAWPP